MITTLNRLIVKDDVRLGRLSDSQRCLALALVWTGLTDGRGYTEPQVNQALKERLAGAAACLGVDHVELRRWLVDLAWLQRDEWGRQYRKVGRTELREALHAFADAVAGTDWDRSAQQARAALAHARASRRARFGQGHEAAAAA